PEIFISRTYSLASDIYSFGIIAYEIASGLLAFNNTVHDINLICSGLRPEIPIHVPKLISDLIVKCWDAKPEKRPSSKELCKTLDELNRSPTEFNVPITKAEVPEYCSILSLSSSSVPLNDIGSYNSESILFMIAPEMHDVLKH
ncbi:17428_t:CDS:1, partial [Cetraspora pellucida]